MELQPIMYTQSCATLGTTMVRDGSATTMKSSTSRSHDRLLVIAFDTQSSRAIFSPGAASLPCAILEEGVSLPSPGAKVTTLRCGARLPARTHGFDHAFRPPIFSWASRAGDALSTQIEPRSS